MTKTIASRIHELHGAFADARCFIIGNGPSLLQTDLRPLKDEYTIGLNRIYLHYARMGFEPTFYCAVNPYVLEQFAREIEALNSMKFVRSDAKRLLAIATDTWFVDSLPGFGFNTNITENPRVSRGALARVRRALGFDRLFGHSSGATADAASDGGCVLRWYEGWTVTFCAMQLAYFLGFRTVILVGVDHRFSQAGAPNQLVTAQGGDANHFHPDYFGKGVRWQYPDLERSERSYRIARKVFERDGRAILDATVGGNLSVFRKIEYASLLDSSLRTESRERAAVDDQAGPGDE